MENDLIIQLSSIHSHYGPYFKASMEKAIYLQGQIVRAVFYW